MSSIHEYLPETLKDVIDLKLLNEDLDIELEQLDGYITGIGNEVIVKSASLYGIEKWEKALGITPKDGDSLETRRFRINNLLTSKLPYTYRWLIKKLTQITGSSSGYTLNINQDDYAITIVLSGLDTNMMIEVQKQLRNAIPSNMVLEIGGPPLVSADIKVGTALRIGTKYIIKSAKTGLPGGKNLFTKQGNATPKTDTTFWNIITKTTPESDGWCKVSSDNTNGTTTVFANQFTKRNTIGKLEVNKTYSILVEVRNLTISGSSSTPSYLQLCETAKDSVWQSKQSYDLAIFKETNKVVFQKLTKTNFDSSLLDFRNFVSVPKGYKVEFEYRLMVVKGSYTIDTIGEYEPFIEL